MRVASYARVSTADQQSLPDQVRRLREYMESRRWDVVLEVAEVASGAKTRPERDKILAMARRREIDAVVVPSLDRWGRSTVDLVTTLTELTSLGVGFVSLREAIDLGTPLGRAMATMLGAFAEFEREMIRERVRAGIAAARAKGKRIGRPKTVIAHAAQIRALHKKGRKPETIARLLEISRTSVRRVLSSEE